MRCWLIYKLTHGGRRVNLTDGLVPPGGVLVAAGDQDGRRPPGESALDLLVAEAVELLLELKPPGEGLRAVCSIVKMEMLA